ARALTRWARPTGRRCCPAFPASRHEGDVMADRRRRWVLIAFGAAVLIVFIGIGVMIAVAARVQQNMQVDARSSDQAETEFAEISRQFGSRQPLLEMQDGR